LSKKHTEGFTRESGTASDKNADRAIMSYGGAADLAWQCFNKCSSSDDWNSSLHEEKELAFLQWARDNCQPEEVT
jgi:hypothetical protein